MQSGSGIDVDSESGVYNTNTCLGYEFRWRGITLHDGGRAALMHVAVQAGGHLDVAFSRGRRLLVVFAIHKGCPKPSLLI